MNNIRIAIQSKGKLLEDSLRFLAERGLRFTLPQRAYIVACTNAPLDLIFLRDDDIPTYVERGVADFGIVGENVLFEKNRPVQVFKELSFGFCKLVIAVPSNCKALLIEDLAGMSIATAYPSLLKRFLDKENVSATIIKLAGSVEIAPRIGFADAVCDLTQTGNTLRENGLRPIATVLESQAVLIRSPFFNKKITDEIKKIFTFAKGI